MSEGQIVLEGKVLCLIPLLSISILVVLRSFRVMVDKYLNMLLAIAVPAAMTYLHVMVASDLDLHLWFFSAFYLLISLMLCLKSDHLQNRIATLMGIYFIALVAFTTRDKLLIAEGIIANSFLLVFILTEYRNKKECLRALIYNVLADGFLFAFAILQILHPGGPAGSCLLIAGVLAKILQLTPVFFWRRSSTVSFSAFAIFYPLTIVLLCSFMLTANYSIVAMCQHSDIISMGALVAGLFIGVYGILSDDLKKSVVAFVTAICVLSFITLISVSRISLQPSIVAIVTSCFLVAFFMLFENIFLSRSDTSLSHFQAMKKEKKTVFVSITVLLILAMGFPGTLAFAGHARFFECQFLAGFSIIPLLSSIVYGFLYFSMLASGVRIWAFLFRSLRLPPGAQDLDSKSSSGFPWLFAITVAPCIVLFGVTGFWPLPGGDLSWKALAVIALIGVYIITIAFSIYIFVVKWERTIELSGILCRAAERLVMIGEFEKLLSVKSLFLEDAYKLFLNMKTGVTVFLNRGRRYLYGRSMNLNFTQDGVVIFVVVIGMVALILLIM